MNSRFFAVLILTVWFAGFAFTGTAQPNWELNPYDFEFSMTVTGKVIINGDSSDDNNDMVAAFANGECRGLTKLIYEVFENEYYAYLMIYGNTPLEQLTFKIFDASENKILTTNDTVDFVVNYAVGSLDSPFIFSSEQLSGDAKILNFQVPGQTGETIINGQNIILKKSINSNVTNIAAGFSVSKGATLFVNDIKQVSNVTRNDFTEPVLFMVVAANLSDTAYYTVEIIIENNSPTAIYLSKTAIGEMATLNTTVATISVEDRDFYDTHIFSLIEGDGFNDAQNSYFEIVDNNLILVHSLNYEEEQLLNVLIRVTDSGGETFSRHVVLKVSDENDPPTAIYLSNTLISESVELNTIVATLDVEDVDLIDSHQFSLIDGDGVNDAQNSYFRIVGDNLILANPLNFNDKQLLTVLIRATDSGGASFEKSFVLQVTNENEPPRFNSKPPTYILQNEIFIYSLNITDNDDEPIQIGFENLPDWLKYNSNSGLIFGVPGNSDVGDYIFKITASDGQMQSVQVVALTVINVNEPPEINKYITNQVFLSNRYNEIQLPADCIIDPDLDDHLTFSLSAENKTALPEWLIFDKETLVISGFPPQGIQAEYNLRLTATDQGRLKEWLVFSLKVDIPTAINELKENPGFRIYPNPVQSNLYIKIPDGNNEANVSFFNMAGQLLKSTRLNPGSTNGILLNGIEPGIYLVRVKQGQLEHFQKIIKN